MSVKRDIGAERYRKLSALSAGDTILVDTRALYLTSPVWTPATFVKWLGYYGEYTPGAPCTLLIEESILAPLLEICEGGSRIVTTDIRIPVTEDN